MWPSLGIVVCTSSFGAFVRRRERCLQKRCAGLERGTFAVPQTRTIFMMLSERVVRTLCGPRLVGPGAFLLLSSDIMKKLSWVLLAFVVAWLPLLFLWNTGCSLTLKEMKPASTLRGPWVPAEQLSVLTVNTWKLREIHRVPRLVQALGTLGRDLGVPSHRHPLPDVVLFQELEDDKAIEALGKALSKTHSFHSCTCAKRKDGGTHSAVAIAVRRARFRREHTRCHDLGSLWPDHQRCAAAVSIVPSKGAPIDIVNVHLSARPGNHPQARTLVQIMKRSGYLKRKRLLVGGDFNFGPGSKGYRVMTEVLRDFFPKPHKRGRTHWFGGRLDFFFVSEQLSLVRVLDRRKAYQAIRPASSLFLPRRCKLRDEANCPLSDHIPEGAVFQHSSKVRE
ncbi:MAG: hypothetical protein EP343_34515 [Deltaproteobacteria bacterium]|nr:MAG: hypothetical protein EP343_34515 [Deltaproteobacteria bacterium]